MVLLTEKLGVKVKNSVRVNQLRLVVAKGKAVGERWGGADINFYVENG